MKIRSITCFCNPLIDGFETSLKHLEEFLGDLKNDIVKEGWEVQTTRLATTPFGYFTNGKDLIRKIQDLEGLVKKHGFTYLSIGPARLHHRDEYQIIPEILSSTENVFLSGSLSHPLKGISVEAIRDCAKIISEAAKISPDGFTNL